MGRDSIIPIHNILCKFIKLEFYIGKKMQKYMAVIPLNKKISFWEIKRNDKYNTEKSIYKSAIVRFKIAAQTINQVL